MSTLPTPSVAASYKSTYAFSRSSEFYEIETADFGHWMPIFLDIVFPATAVLRALNFLNKLNHHEIAVGAVYVAKAQGGGVP